MEKHKKIDTKAIEYHIAGILKALGDNPEREGLKDTPKRVAKMYEEVFDGMNYTNEEIADMFNKTFALDMDCLLYTSPSPRDGLLSRMPSSA